MKRNPLAVAALSVAALSVAALTLAPAASAHAQSNSGRGTPSRPTGGATLTHADADDFNDHTGWKQIFDGKSLAGWDGTPDVWSVEDGAIVGKSSDAKPSGTTNVIWRGGQPANFRIRFEYKMEGQGANGGFQYRGDNLPPPTRQAPDVSKMTPEQRARFESPEMKARMATQAELLKKYAKWNIYGYQLDFDANNRYTGQLYEQMTGRGIIAWRGDAVVTAPGVKKVKVASLGTPDELKQWVKPLGEWNQAEVIADGHVLTHIINGHVMAQVIDTDPKYENSKGFLAFEIEGPGDVKISHRNIWLQELP